MRVSRNVLSSALVLAVVTTACAHAPEARREEPRQEQADIAGIGPRPKVFGRHAWDAAQKRAAARQAEAKASSPAPAAPMAAPAPVVAAAPPPPAPLPVLPAAPASPPAQAVAAASPSAPAPTAPTPAALPAAPQVAVATPPAAPAPVAPATPPRQIAAASPPAPAITITTPPPPPGKKPGLWERITTPPPEPAVVAGGYGPARDKDAVAAAAAFAVHESPGYVLKAIYSAKTQVVAGTNYSLCLWVRRPTLEPNPLHRRMVAATVFQGLDQHYELISWKEVENCHAGTPPQ